MRRNSIASYSLKLITKSSLSETSSALRCFPGIAETKRGCNNTRAWHPGWKPWITSAVRSETDVESDGGGALLLGPGAGSTGARARVSWCRETGWNGNGWMMCLWVDDVSSVEETSQQKRDIFIQILSKRRMTGKLLGPLYINLSRFLFCNRVKHAIQSYQATWTSHCEWPVHRWRQASFLWQFLFNRFYGT